MYMLLSLANIEIGVMDKVKYYVCQVDCLFNVDKLGMPTSSLAMTSDNPLPTQGKAGPKTEGLDEEENSKNFETISPSLMKLT